MSIVQLLILQVIAHLLADFALQPSKQAKEKNVMGLKSPFLKWHILIAFALAWLLSFQVLFVVGAAAIALLHWLIDALKKNLANQRLLKRYAFFIDQFLHLGVIVAVVFYFSSIFEIKPFIPVTVSEMSLAAIAGYLFCAKPANIFIKEIFFSFEIDVKTNNSAINELPNAGKLIGTVERWLVLTFMLINQISAIGFLLAAKSILRYRDTDTLKTEYVLIGTMISFGFAIVLGIAINSWF